jgi:Putative amidoligase enzyme.
MPEMREQRWGLELEMTGISRAGAAKVMADYFGTSFENDGGFYGKYSVQDDSGRRWTVMSDSSITKQKKVDGEIVDTIDDAYSVELVTPICKYEDIESLQEIVRKLRKAGALVNKSCGIHVHVDGAGHTPKSIRNIINIVASKNDLLYQALQIEPSQQSYCKKLDEQLIDQMNRYKPEQMSRIEDIWYNALDAGNNRTSHYNASRYHFLNLHSFFHGNGTLEFRGYNATLHAGKVKTAIQLSLAMCHQAKIQRSASRRVTQTDNPKYTFRTYLLRLGLIGEEFATARQHLLEPLPGNIAWRDPAQAEQQRERQRQARALQQQQEQEYTPTPASEPEFSL